MYEVNTNTELAMQVLELTKQMKTMCNMMIEQGQNSSNEVCAICNNLGHATNICPSSENFPEFVEHANVMNSYNQRPNNPFSNTYNPGWRNYPNFAWRNNQQHTSSGNNNQQRKPSLEETLDNFIQVSQKNNQNSNKDTNNKRHPSGRKDKVEEKLSSAPIQSENIDSTYVPPKPYVPHVPFPSRLNKSKWDKSFSNIYDILSKVNVNLPLLDMIRNMPAYANFFKELNTRKHKYEPNEKVIVSETVSVVLQCKLPPKLKDLGSFIINITVGNKQKERAMLDLGASINLMAFSIYKQCDWES
ncbi:uncharacterized protein LOC116117314 [Pistacia vera]|uniref:uncharacterized protein LOC116117314 n=1 Tax=Pistacia vera TaxID=55513 RepID=UPI001263DE1D|nr:uncharacterized protein LOC116117314 [Pistacia vera]